MGNYIALNKMLKKTKSRTNHVCINCGKNIVIGEIYYREHMKDKFLQALHAKKFCALCYEKEGEKLLNK